MTSRHLTVEPVEVSNITHLNLFALALARDLMNMVGFIQLGVCEHLPTMSSRMRNTVLSLSNLVIRGLRSILGDGKLRIAISFNCSLARPESCRKLRQGNQI